MDVLDEPQIQSNQNSVSYGGFWIRFGAMIIDSLILGPLTFGVMYFNIVSWKSSALLILASLIGLAYKPVMEFLYGATLGKMAVKIKVVNEDFEKPNLQEALFRNVLQIVPQLIVLYFTIDIYLDPGFEDVTGFMEYSSFTQQFTSLQYTNMASGLITIVDAIFLLADKQKRSLHDRIGRTYVIER